MSPLARRVLYVEGNVDGTIGGSYFSLLYLVTGLDRTRFEPIVVFGAMNDLMPRFREAGVNTIVHRHRRPACLPGRLGRLAAKAVNFYRGFIRDPLSLARLLRRERVALVHLNNSLKTNHAWIIASMLVRIPCITHERGINEHFVLRDRCLVRRLHAVICISEAVEKNLIARNMGGLRLVTIHNGLDPAEMRVTRSVAEIREEIGVSPTTRLVGIVGNVKPWKGQELVIRAMGRLRDEFPELVCVLIGETPVDGSPYREELAEIVNKMDLVDRVVITGYRRDVANYVNALEILIHASIQPEPFGRVLLEGMALGKPLVASDGGAVPEIVVDGKTGLLFKPGDVEALAGCLRTLLRDRQQASVLGKAGRTRLEEEFSITRNVQQTELLYEHCLNR